MSEPAVLITYILLGIGTAMMVSHLILLIVRMARELYFMVVGLKWGKLWE